MSKPLPIVQYWDSPEPPDYVSELTGSFARLNPGRPHLLFNADTADEFIAERFTERESAAFRACGPAAMQADYFRCCALLELGGVWADAGLECVGNVSTLLEGSEGGELFRSLATDEALMNSLLAFAVPGHPFLRLVIELSTKLIERRWQGKVNQVTGPLVLTAIYRLHRAGSIDAFMGEIEDDAQLLRYARLMCELIGDPGRATEACEGIRVRPAESRRKWVRDPSATLPHRTSADRWGLRGSDIYAEPASKSQPG